LAVGDSTDLEIIYSTGKHRGAASKQPSISTNEGPPDRRVTIKVTVVAQPDSTFPLVINPYRLYVSKAGEVEVDESKFTMTNVSDEDLNVTVVSQPYGYFQLDIPKTVKAGQAAECKLKVHPQYLGEPFEKSITIELSDAAKTRFSIPVVRRLIGAGAPSAKGEKGATGQKGSSDQ
jgi:hypothetical protein